MKALVAFYSRTGRTKKVAEEIQARLGSDIEEIRDEKKRGGILGWLSAGRDAGSKALTKIKDVDKQPSEYQVVIIGSPTWNGSVSVPIRTYINSFKDDFNQVAIFSTGEGEEPSALEEMSELLGERVFAGMHLVRTSEIDSDSYFGKLDDFVERISMHTKRG